MPTFKNIGINATQLARLGNYKSKTPNNYGSVNVNFEHILATSLAHLYKKDIDLKKDPLNDATPVFDPARALELDEEAKFEEGLKTVFKHEGSRLVQKDGGNESSKYGVIESTAREYGFKGDIRSLSKADAEIIYRKIWEKSGAKTLPHPLSVIHFDTYVNNPSMAKKLLAQSNGNTDTYLRLRLQRYKRIAQLRPERYGKYLKGWVNRVNNLKAIASSCSNMYTASSTNNASRS